MMQPTIAAVFVVGVACMLACGVQTELLVRIHRESQGQTPYAIATIIDSHGRKSALGNATITDGAVACRSW